MTFDQVNGIVEKELQDTFQQTLKDIHVNLQVQIVMEEMIHDIETWDHTLEKLTLQKQLYEAQQMISRSLKEQQQLQEQNRQMENKVVRIQTQAKELAGTFRGQLCNIKRDLNHNKKLERDLEKAHDELITAAQVSRDLAVAHREIRELKRAQSLDQMLNPKFSAEAASATTNRVPPPLHSQSNDSAQDDLKLQQKQGFFNMPEATMFAIFTYVTAADVVALSHTSKRMLFLVNKMFGMKSGISSRVSGPLKVSRAEDMNSQIQARPRRKVVESKTGRMQQNMAADQLLKNWNKQEVKFFHEMATRAKKLQATLATVQAEKEDLAARLQGAERVKGFLMDKLKEVEDALAATIEKQAQFADNANTDQEIIGYLDARSQKLQRKLQKLTIANTELRNTIETSEKSTEERVKLIEDMVNLLADEKRGLEHQLKAERKVLAREIKTLRAQNIDLTSEKDEYVRQLRQIRDSIALLVPTPDEIRTKHAPATDLTHRRIFS